MFIRIHSCGTDGSQCQCKRKINPDVAIRLMHEGKLKSMLFQKANGEFVANDHELALVVPEEIDAGRELKDAGGLVAEAVEKRHIERAYIRKNERERKRIVFYGNLAHYAGRNAWRADVEAQQTNPPVTAIASQ